jgi:hypothetical protein
MLDAALVASGLMMGLAGTPHCTAMCGAACGALARRCAPGRPGGALAAWHAGRLAGYAAVGAVAASSVGLLRSLGEAAPLLHPLWLLLHLAALALGLWLLVLGRQPAWLANLGRSPGMPAGDGERGSAVPLPSPKGPAGAGGGRARRPLHWSGPLRAAAAGVVWPALPCGLLQSAVVVAALASGAAGGAATMGAFALGSSLGLVAGPALWWRLTGGSPALAGRAPGWALRLAGAGLAGAAGWALGHGLWQRVAALCA